MSSLFVCTFKFVKKIAINYVNTKKIKFYKLNFVKQKSEILQN